MPTDSISKKTVPSEYLGKELHFSDNGWFNATEAAKVFGKRVQDWLDNEDTKRYLIALAAHLNHADWRDLKKARRGKNGGTWLHPKAGVAFARWLDTDFAIWCDLQIDSIIRGEHPSYDWQRARVDCRKLYPVMCDILQVMREGDGKETQKYHYANEAKMLNQALFGNWSPVDRDSLTQAQLNMLCKAERINTANIARGMPYVERKAAVVAAITPMLPSASQQGKIE